MITSISKKEIKKLKNNTKRKWALKNEVQNLRFSKLTNCKSRLFEA